jgi:hypothetical protein
MNYILSLYLFIIMQLRAELAPKELKSIILKYVYSNIHHNKICKLNEEYHSIYKYDNNEDVVIFKNNSYSYYAFNWRCIKYRYPCIIRTLDKFGEGMIKTIHFTP